MRGCWVKSADATAPRPWPLARRLSGLGLSGILAAFIADAAFAASANGCERIGFALAREPSETRFERFRDAAVADAERCLAARGSEGNGSRALFASALAARREDIALALLERGLRPESPSAVANAAAKLELPLVLDALLSGDASILQSQHGGRTPLVVAAASGSYRAAKTLLDAGADPDLGLPMAAATRSVNLHVARLLIARGASVAALPADAAGELLSVAAEFSHWPFVDALLDLGLDPNLRGPDGHALFYAGRHDAHGDRPGFVPERMNIWAALIGAGADPAAAACDAPVGDGAADWFYREIERHQRTCDADLGRESGIEPEADEARDSHACLRIEEALLFHPSETYRQRRLEASLEDAAACVRAVRPTSRRALRLLSDIHWAKRDDIAIGLLSEGLMPMPLARTVRATAAMGRTSLLGALLDADASLANAQFEGGTPLEAAAEVAAYDTAELLLDRGADPRAGKPLRYALAAHHLDVAQLLLERMGGGRALPPDAAGDALFWAVRETNWRFVDHMLRYGFDANARSQEGHHVLLAASLNAADGEDLWGTLVMHGADPLAAICELEDQVLAQVLDVPRRWIDKRILDHRKRCLEGATE